MIYFCHEPHTNSPEDLVILHCHSCGWQSDELSVDQVSARGHPWYCDWCNKTGLHWVRFHPKERAEALMCLPERGAIH